MVAEAEKVFDGMDEDGSGTVSLEEFSHVVGAKHAPAVLQSMDVNHDGGGVTRAKFFGILGPGELEVTVGNDRALVPQLGLMRKSNVFVHQISCAGPTASCTGVQAW